MKLERHITKHLSFELVKLGFKSKSELWKKHLKIDNSKKSVRKSSKRYKVVRLSPINSD